MDGVPAAKPAVSALRVAIIERHEPVSIPHGASRAGRSWSGADRVALLVEVGGEMRAQVAGIVSGAVD